MNRKIIFLDLDGTLFDVPRGLYEPTIKTRETISKLKKNGHLVFICSGRCKCLLDDFIKSLDVSGFVLGNGTYCEMNNEVLFNDMFSYSTFRKSRFLICFSFTVRLIEFSSSSARRY